MRIKRGLPQASGVFRLPTNCRLPRSGAHSAVLSGVVVRMTLGLLVPGYSMHFISLSNAYRGGCWTLSIYRNSDMDSALKVQARSILMLSDVRCILARVAIVARSYVYPRLYLTRMRTVDGRNLVKKTG